MSQFFSRTFWYALACMAVLYGLGVLGYTTSMTGWLLAALGIGSAAVAVRRLDLALYLAFIELFSNPHGTLLREDVFGLTFSLRMAIFVGIMAGWGILWAARTHQPSLKDGRAQAFLFIGLSCALGFILGVLWRDPLAVFKDGNAYLYLLYLLPILSVHWTERHRHDLLQLLAAGAVWIAGASLAILYLFSHFGADVLAAVYGFLRDLRIAEVTDLGNGTYRVFLQSQAYTVMVGWFVLALSGVVQKKLWLASLGGVVVAVVLISLSRSFWMGIAPPFTFLLVVLFRTTRPAFVDTVRFAGWVLLCTALGVAILFAVALFPVPSPTLGGASLVDSLKARTTQTDDVAISSRWRLLTPMVNAIFESPLVGHGFGKEVAFQTDDPRVRILRPDGTWSTAAMEWGWLELWVKMGVLGPLAFLYAGYELIRRLWAYRWTQQAWIGLALVAGLIFIYSTHFFSPYLNHPIGLGYLLFLVPFLPIKKQAPSGATAFIEELLARKQPSVAVASES